MNRQTYASGRLLILQILVFCTSLAQANDSAMSGTASNIRFIKNDRVVIHRERLNIGPLAREVPIRVEYEMENQGNDDEKIEIGFPIPSCDLSTFVNESFGRLMASAGPCVARPEMRLEVDGIRQSPEGWTLYLEWKGKPLGESELKENKKVGDAIRSIGGIISNWDSERQGPEPAELMKVLGTICSSMGGTLSRDPDSMPYNYPCPAFKQMQVQWVYRWDHVFKPGKRVKVVHHYRAESSHNLDPLESFPDDRFCLKEEPGRTLFKKFRALDGNEKDWHHHFVGYILKTGGNWARPIGHFELSIEKAHPDQAISTCFSGLKKESPIKFSFSKKNYSPDRDLDLYFVDFQNLGKK